MALRDYILCGKCDAKVIYDGDDRIRDNLFDRTHEAIRCAACAVKDIEELHDLRAQLAERDATITRQSAALAGCKDAIEPAIAELVSEFGYGSSTVDALRAAVLAIDEAIK